MEDWDNKIGRLRSHGDLIILKRSQHTLQRFNNFRQKMAASRLYNLDETGVTSNEDSAGRLSQKTFTRTSRLQTEQYLLLIVSNVSWNTIIATVCANGTYFTLLIVIKGGNISYWGINLKKRYDMESVNDCLPEGALVAVSDDTSAAEDHNFADWARRFASHGALKKGGSR